MLQLWNSMYEGEFIAVEPFGHSVLGSLIGFLLVMRMNASNSRFWEGRSHWGSIVNASRNLSRAASAYTKDGKYFAGLVAGYAITLKQSLRDSRDLSEAEQFLPSNLYKAAEFYGNQPTAIAGAMTHWVAEKARDGSLSQGEVYYFEKLIAALVNAQGGCEKIQKTPLPFAYVSLIKLLILVYLATLPVVICGLLGWWSPLLMAILALGMFGMEEASVEIEDPFGTQPNCLKLEVLTITITRDSGQLAAYDEIMHLVQENQTAKADEPNS
jgi:putative membrane protein